MDLPSSSIELFKRRNALGVVPGFTAIAPHVLYTIGGVVYAFWLYQGSPPLRARTPEVEQLPPLALLAPEF